MDRMSTKGQMIDQIDLRGVPHSGFDRSNHNYGTGKLGAIIPVRLDEVYPGDRIKGNPEMVVNFEPLAAPLMGSMVLKQESFYVPYPQLWRHAYKFFTGKNGFNDPMPSKSPRDIFNVYVGFLYDYIFSRTGRAGVSDTDAIGDLLTALAGAYDTNKSVTDPDNLASVDLKTLYTAFLGLLETPFQECYEERKMWDLAYPAIKPFFDLYDNSVAKTRPGLPVYEEKIQGNIFDYYYVRLRLPADYYHDGVDFNKDLLEFGNLLADMLRDMFMYFHGPSSLFDYLGWPTVTDTKDQYGIEIFRRFIDNNIRSFGSNCLYDELLPFFSQVPLSFMPFKAYYLIWYWNYRDQLLETGILDPEDDEFLGTSITDNVIMYTTLLRQRCWFKDTFTTALTNTGDGNLLVPTFDAFSQPQVTYYNSDNEELANTTDAQQALDAGATIAQYSIDGLVYRVPMNYLSTGFIHDNSSTLSYPAVSLDLFDRIKRLRSFVQKRLVLGYEVDDVIWSSFMVRLSNVRMHIPEILGRGRDAVQINTIVNNTSTDQQIAGDKTATAWAHGKQSEMNYFSEEWGLFLTFTTVMPIQSYAGGLQRLYLKRDRFDFMWPEFATMGMDAVYNCELAAFGTRLTDTQGLQVFGYQGRYYDLKSRQDEEHGRLLTDLNYLTFSREWDNNNPPKLNYIFVHCWPRLDGFVVESPLVDVFRFDCYNAHAWERRLPVPSEIVG